MLVERLQVDGTGLYYSPNRTRKPGLTSEGTNALQFFMDKYSYKGESVKSRYETVNKMLATFAPKVYPTWWNEDEYFKGLTYEQAFNKLAWDGYAVYSTPLLANVV